MEFHKAYVADDQEPDECLILRGQCLVGDSLFGQYWDSTVGSTVTEALPTGSPHCLSKTSGLEAGGRTQFCCKTDPRLVPLQGTNQILLLIRTYGLSC